MPVELQATYAITTPLFCARDSASPAEFRIPSFKGQLRFWWRALRWPELRGEDEERLCALRREEDRLFGSATSGQARVRLCLIPPQRQPTPLPKGTRLKEGRSQRDVGIGVRYLGYGLMGAFGPTAGQLTRPAALHMEEVSVRVRLVELSPEEQSQIERALVVLGLAGSLGARSRKGFGSLAWRRGQGDWLRPAPVIAQQSDVRDAVDEWIRPVLRGAIGCGYAPFTAFSRRSRVIVLKQDEAQNALQILDWLGREMVRYRSWGNRGKILDGIPSERRFQVDHDLIRQQPVGRNEFPRRIAFGLPHTEKISPADYDRRASPLFIHADELTDGSLLILTHLPSVFLPEPRPRQRPGLKIHRERVMLPPDDQIWATMEAFLDRLLGRGEGDNRPKEGLQAEEIR